MSDFFQLVEQRESCRNYDPQKRPTKEQLVRCIQAAVELSGHQFP